ncbi:MAG: hypothetical protein Q4P79_03500 [Fusobacterium sp.]|nr:hypothetical protein [Fusobacterium sp.]MDO5788508.1 hypothetical protein [Fusobacterium sp.]
MLEIQNYKSINSVLLKNRNYTTLIGDDEILLQNICESINNYYNKKIEKSREEKLVICNFFSKTKESISSKNCIYIADENLDSELGLGAKTELTSKLTKLFKEKMPIEPILVTINSLIEDLELEESTIEMSDNISKYSKHKIKFSFEKLAPSDFIKKIRIDFEEDEIILKEIEKLKLYLGIMDKNELNKENIYIFLFPERKIPPQDIRELKNFLLKLAEKNQVIVATFSKYLLNFSELDSINLYLNNKLKNLDFEEEIIKKVEEEYPILKNRNEIREKLKYILQKYLFEILVCNKVSNKIFSESENIFIPDYESLFLFLIYLKLSNIPYIKDINFDKTSPFSNYIEKRL